MIIGESLFLFADEISRLFEYKNTDVSVIQEPQSRNLTEWFSYYHQVCASIKITLRDIANKTHYNYDYVRQEHAKYKKSIEG